MDRVGSAGQSRRDAETMAKARKPTAEASGGPAGRPGSGVALRADAPPAPAAGVGGRGRRGPGRRRHGGWLYARARGPIPGEFVPSLGNDHIQTSETPHVAYNSDPPTSGPHLPYIAPWGVHARPIAKELQVHNLEDGGVVVQLQARSARTRSRRDSCSASWIRYPDHVVLAPYPALDRCIALTAWTRIDKLDELDERRVVRFIEAYRGIDHHPR